MICRIIKEQTMRSMISTAFLMVSLFLSTEVFADNRDDAKKLYKEGIELQKKGDDNGATKAFEESVKLFPNKSNLYNLACSYRVVNRPLNALSTFERIQREFGDKLKTDKEMKADIDKQTAEINASLAKLTVTTVPEGAKVVLDKQDIGETPFKEPIKLVAGTHFVEVSHDGYESVSQNVILEQGSVKEASFNLPEKRSELSVTVNQPDATVSVDGMEKGKTPLSSPLSLTKGDHIVKITKDGFTAAEQTVTLL
jgi:tetratricopeptide (TPR) repeat protein